VRRGRNRSVRWRCQRCGRSGWGNRAPSGNIFPVYRRVGGSRLRSLPVADLRALSNSLDVAALCQECLLSERALERRLDRAGGTANKR